MSSTMRLHFAALALSVSALTGTSAQADDNPRPIPPQYGFPADHFHLLESLDRIDFVSMRRHAWDLWAGLTHQDSPGSAAVFETWYPADHVFNTDASPPSRLRSFRTHLDSAAQHPGESLIAHVIYNASARDHILRHRLQHRATLERLNAGFDARKTPRSERTIERFPRDAVVIKMVWWPVKADAATALPVWDGPYLPQNHDGTHPEMPAEHWPNAVWVLPPGIDRPGASPPRAGLTMRGSYPLDHFYSFRITRGMLNRLDAGEQDGFKDIRAGDYAVLVAMHVTTREIHNWVWATYWWHDRPDEGHLAAGRPDTVKGKWRRFLMNTAYSMDTPGAPDKGPHIVYNPYIEAKFANGVQSNCAACHNRASFPELTNTLCGALPVTRGSHDYQPASPEREGRTKLEFLWSLLIRPLPGPPGCMK